ncbi:MAG: DUF503 domain-containing protein [Planctomycetes bacterium]|nr:DUF503 domain-containing protein [Planctomycetota bacterium]
MAAVVGVLHLELMIGDATSLKDKRRVVKSFKDRLRSRHNVSVAEVDFLDSHRHAGLAVAMVGNDARYVKGALQQVANAAGAHRGMYVISSEIELW